MYRIGLVSSIDRADVTRERTALRAAAILSAVGVVVFGAGCATNMAAGSGDEQAVSAQAQARWDALLAGDADKAYSFWSAGSRAMVTLNRYRKIVPEGFWTSAKVESVSCASEQCEAKVALAYKFAPFSREVRGHQVVTETWIKEGDAWVYVYKP